MLKLIINLPDNVLGVEAIGKVTAEDYQTVLVPALEAKFGKTRRIRLLYVLGDKFSGLTGAAAWEDAKVGLSHLARFDRVAVVTNVEWISHAMKAFGFAIPGEIKVFENDHLKQAREWASEPSPIGDLEYEFLVEEGVLILSPKGELDASDFERIADEIDPYIENRGKLKGLMILAEHFPGWDDFAALAAHFRFVKAHRLNIKRLAIVTDDRLMSSVSHLANHFLVNEARHFSMSKRHDALAWVSQG
jgi:hypothetical protein